MSNTLNSDNSHPACDCGALMPAIKVDGKLIVTGKCTNCDRDTLLDEASSAVVRLLKVIHADELAKAEHLDDVLRLVREHILKNRIPA